MPRNKLWAHPAQLRGPGELRTGQEMLVTLLFCLLPQPIPLQDKTVFPISPRVWKETFAEQASKSNYYHIVPSLDWMVKVSLLKKQPYTRKAPVLRASVPGPSVDSSSGLVWRQAADPRSCPLISSDFGKEDGDRALHPCPDDLHCWAQVCLGPLDSTFSSSMSPSTARGTSEEGPWGQRL